MSVEVNLMPSSVIEAKLGIQPKGAVHKFFTEQCADHMDKYVPFSGGGGDHLADVVKTVDTIEYHKSYARYMYEGKVMGPNIPIKDANGNIVKWFSRKPKYLTDRDINYSNSRAQAGHEFAGPHWDKQMWSAEKNDVLKEVADYIQKYGGK